MKDIALTGVKSSAVHSIGYDPETQTLRVRFHNGGMYDHEGVPPETYAAFTGAASHGSFYNRKIARVHRGTKIG